mgnify:CR=1 FL=1
MSRWAWSRPTERLKRLPRARGRPGADSDPLRRRFEGLPSPLAARKASRRRRRTQPSADSAFPSSSALCSAPDLGLLPVVPPLRSSFPAGPTPTPRSARSASIRSLRARASLRCAPNSLTSATVRKTNATAAVAKNNGEAMSCKTLTKLLKNTEGSRRSVRCFGVRATKDILHARFGQRKPPFRRRTGQRVQTKKGGAGQEGRQVKKGCADGESANQERVRRPREGAQTERSQTKRRRARRAA